MLLEASVGFTDVIVKGKREDVTLFRTETYVRTHQIKYRRNEKIEEKREDEEERKEQKGFFACGSVLLL